MSGCRLSEIVSVIHCWFLSFQYKNQPTTILGSNFQGCLYSLRFDGLNEVFMHACGGDEKCQVFLHKPTFEIMTFHVILFEQHYCLSKKINKKLKTLHTSNCIPTIVGDTAPPAGCSQYLTGTSGSFYRLFKNISVLS